MSGGFNVGKLTIPGVIDVTLEISDDAKFEQRMKEVNAELRFKHKITDPVWETRKIGGGQPVTVNKPRRKMTEADKKRISETKAEDRKILDEVKQRREGKPARPAQQTPKTLPVKLPDAPPVPPVEREGSIAGEVDLAAARRLARGN